MEANGKQPGFERSTTGRWLDHEITALTAHYTSTPTEQLCSLLPGRSRHAIVYKAWTMGLAKDIRSNKKTQFNLPEIERAYLAGFIDGEGCIYIGRNRPYGKGKNPSYHLVVSVSNTNKTIIEYLRATFGGYVSSMRRRANHRPCQSWAIRNQRARAFLEVVLPYLRQKKAEAELAIDFQKEIVLGGLELTQETLDRREWYRQRVLYLKGKQDRIKEMEK